MLTCIILPTRILKLTSLNEKYKNSIGLPKCPVEEVGLLPQNYFLDALAWPLCPLQSHPRACQSHHGSLPSLPIQLSHTATLTFPDRPWPCPWPCPQPQPVVAVCRAFLPLNPSKSQLHRHLLADVHGEARGRESLPVSPAAPSTSTCSMCHAAQQSRLFRCQFYSSDCARL